MAGRLAAVHALTVWNRTAATADGFAARHDGVRVAGSPRELAEACDTVVLCLATSGDVESVCQGPDGLEAGLRPGALVVDCTSGEPAAARALASRLAARGIDYADAPVSGGTNGAAAGTLAVMVGCPEALFPRIEAVVAPFAGTVVRMGDVGTGDAMKAVNNALLALNIQAVGEGLAGLTRAGINPRQALEVINQSSGRSFVSEVLVPERVLTNTWPRTFRLALLHKDAAIATALLAEQGVDAPLLDQARECFASARAALGESADYLEAIRVVEQQAGVEIRG
jgi:3-hydroxyisobutyrate dehydrogenase